MRSIPFPAALNDALALVELGLGDDALTPAESLSLNALFDDYRAKAGRSDRIVANAAFNAQRGADLKKAYGQTWSKGRLAYVRSKLKAAAGNRCTSCGGSRHDQLDHHLPKTSYGEFAIFVENLLPSCVGCNQKKSTHVGATEATAFLHPYFEAIPNQPYVKVEILRRPGTILAVLSFDDAAPIADAMMKTRMKHQFERVDVNARVSSELIELMEEQADTIDGELGGADAATVAAYLVRAADRLGRRHGEGSWRAAVFRALANDAEFCDGEYQLLVR